MSGKTLWLLLVSVTLLILSPAGGAASGYPPEPENDVIMLFDPPPSSVPAGSFHKNKTNRNISVTADAAVVMDADTGQLLYAKNHLQPRPIASTTKIMTALLAIELGDLKQVVTVTPRAARVEGSSIYLKAGERLTLEELLYGALMRSGNDACVAIADHIAGREEIFVGWMNLKARMLGLKNTNFSNTNGLPHKEHLSSAYDLAVITRHALKNPVFNSIVASRKYSISSPVGQRRRLSNTNEMLWKYPGADGVKTGTTNAAGRCLVSSASREGRRLISVVLHSDDRYADSIKLLDYGFTGFRNRTVARSGEELTSINVSDGVKNRVAVVFSEDIVVTVPSGETGVVEKVVTLDHNVEAPVDPGLPVGRILVSVMGEPVAETGLITGERVERLPAYRLIMKRTASRLNNLKAVLH
ncbi:MAG: D-alanyl-D-alanine carboxypeptidase family protein [Bacillota bacterium]